MDKRETQPATVDAIERALAAAGIEFIPEDASGGAGLRFRKGKRAAPSPAPRKAKAKAKRKRKTRG